MEKIVDAGGRAARERRARTSTQATVVDDPDVVLSDLQRLGRAEVAVDVCARATDGGVVVRATFNWSLTAGGLTRLK